MGVLLDINNTQLKNDSLTAFHKKKKHIISHGKQKK